MQDTVRGVERTRIWPEPKGSRQTRAQLAQQEWFRQANWAFKLQAPQIQATMTAATKTTSLYPRDIFSIMASGGMFALVMPDKRIAYPMATIMAVSESLDALSQTPGYTLVRGPQFWVGAPQIPQQGVLSSRITNSANKPLVPSGTIIQWDTATFDEVNLWSSAAPGRLIVPAGVTRLQIGVNLTIDGGAASNTDTNILKNGQPIASQSMASGFAAYNVSIDTGPLNVVEGDYFEVRSSRSTSTAKTLVAAASAFWARFG